MPRLSVAGDQKGTHGEGRPDGIQWSGRGNRGASLRSVIVDLDGRPSTDASGIPSATSLTFRRGLAGIRLDLLGGSWYRRVGWGGAQAEYRFYPGGRSRLECSRLLREPIRAYAAPRSLGGRRDAIYRCLRVVTMLADPRGFIFRARWSPNAIDFRGNEVPHLRAANLARSR
jgi:hypothetical protein